MARHQESLEDFKLRRSMVKTTFMESYLSRRLSHEIPRKEAAVMKASSHPMSAQTKREQQGQRQRTGLLDGLC